MEIGRVGGMMVLAVEIGRSGDEGEMGLAVESCRIVERGGMDEPRLPSGASTFFIPFQQPPRSFLGARRFCRFEHEPPALSLLVNYD